MKTFDNVVPFIVGSYYITHNDNNDYYAVLTVRANSVDTSADILDENGCLNVDNYYTDTRPRVKSIFFVNRQQAELYNKFMLDNYEVEKEKDETRGVTVCVLSEKQGGKPLPRMNLAQIEVSTEKYLIVNDSTKSGYYEDEPGKPRVYSTVFALFAMKHTPDGWITVEANGDAESALKRRFSRAVSSGNYVLYEDYLKAKQAQTTKSGQPDLTGVDFQACGSLLTGSGLHAFCDKRI